MKRSHVHLAFGGTVLALGLLTAYQSVRLLHAQRVNEAITAARVDAVASEIPEARFARVLALAAAGDYDTAAAAYKELAQEGRADLKHAALYNLGNLHLREALEGDTDNTAQRLPLIELAKQSYRSVLREQPDDWSARYNLETALRLAPEVEETAMAEEGPPPDSERTTSTIASARMDLP